MSDLLQVFRVWVMSLGFDRALFGDPTGHQPRFDSPITTMLSTEDYTPLPRQLWYLFVGCVGVLPFVC